jgi:hypothetical protein
MDEREFNLTLFRAFQLGARLTAESSGKELALDDLAKLMGQLFRIAAGEEALQDLTGLSSKLDPDLREFAHRLSGKSIKPDRDLCQHIMRGFEAAADVSDYESDS